MRRIVYLLFSLLVVALFLISTTSGGNMNYDIVAPNDTIYERVEVGAAYAGGNAALQRFISKEGRMPQYVIDNFVEGKITVRFVIGKNGKGRDFSIYNSDIRVWHYGEYVSLEDVVTPSNRKVYAKAQELLEEDALRVCKSMKRWIPAKIGDEYVDSWTTCDINYTYEYEKEQKINKENAKRREDAGRNQFKQRHLLRM